MNDLKSPEELLCPSGYVWGVVLRVLPQTWQRVGQSELSPMAASSDELRDVMKLRALLSKTFKVQLVASFRRSVVEGVTF